jgi:hypothetical protein
MKVKVDGRTLHDAMQRKLERMKPHMEELNQQEEAYKRYVELKRNTPWYKRWKLWRHAVSHPDDDLRNVWFRIRYEELESALRHMKVDESYFIDSLEFGEYGLE